MNLTYPAKGYECSLCSRLFLQAGFGSLQAGPLAGPSADSLPSALAFSDSRAAAQPPAADAISPSARRTGGILPTRPPAVTIGMVALFVLPILLPVFRRRRPRQSSSGGCAGYKGEVCYRMYPELIGAALFLCRADRTCCFISNSAHRRCV